MENSGIFKGSPLTGLGYRTATCRGLTDQQGRFQYREGETLTFSIGGLTLGSARGEAVLSLVDLFPQARDAADPRVVNLCVLFQTLDQDGNLKNGIQITEDISNIVSSFAGRIRFDQSPETFRRDSEVKALMNALNAAKVFPDTGNFGFRVIRHALAAQAHFLADTEPSLMKSTCHRVVEISCGKVNGYATGHNTHTFLGIPYAKPPVGERRWRPPQPPEPWTGIRDCTQWGDQCGQGDLGPASYGNMSEDCLNLNVVAPADTDGKALPVMVWFHGGGFHAMSANSLLYNHPALTQKGVVMVSVTHRLGPLGYLAHPAFTAESEHGASGNYGQMDLVAALKWVRDNIAAFGGDPGCVTIYGESGGGGKTFNLILSPLAKGLFHRAIIQSGVWSIKDLRAMPLKDAEARGEKLAVELGITGKGEAALKALREKPWQEVVAAGQKIRFNDLRLITIDNHYLLDEESNVFKRKLHNDVPVIMGANRTDMAFGMVEGIRDWVRVMGPNSLSKLYVYLFAHVPSRWRREGVVAFHGLEIPYVFGMVRSGLASGTVSNLARTGGAKQPDPGVDAKDDEISSFMMNLWSGFAKTGNPNASMGGQAVWEAYETEKDNFLFIGDEGPTLQMRSGIVAHYEPPPDGTPPLIPVS
jgi:para-nitrobenzyl esterase